jgi:hypothetical protein
MAKDYARRRGGPEARRGSWQDSKRAKTSVAELTQEQTEARFQRLHHHSALLHSLWRKAAVRVPTPEKIPSFSSMCPSPPHGTIGPFLPLVSKTIQPHFLRVRLTLRANLTLLICASFNIFLRADPPLLSSDWPAHYPSPKHHVLNCLRPASRPNLKGAALRSLDSWLSYCFELDCQLASGPVCTNSI